MSARRSNLATALPAVGLRARVLPQPDPTLRRDAENVDPDSGVSDVEPLAS